MGLEHTLLIFREKKINFTIRLEIMAWYVFPLWFDLTVLVFVESMRHKFPRCLFLHVCLIFAMIPIVPQNPFSGFVLPSRNHRDHSQGLKEKPSVCWSFYTCCDSKRAVSIEHPKQNMTALSHHTVLHYSNIIFIMAVVNLTWSSCVWYSGLDTPSWVHKDNHLC